MPVASSINKEEFRKAFMERANVVFEDQEKANKLTVLKNENIKEIISVVENWDEMGFKRTPLRHKWNKK